MRILGIGIGREHALKWALAQCPGVEQSWVIWNTKDPEDSMARVLNEVNAFEPVFAMVWTQQWPLIEGLADRLTSAGVPVCGPSQAAIRLETSKIFAYRFASVNGIPVPEFRVYEDFESSRRDIVNRFNDGDSLPVLKADGMPPSKGVCVPHTLVQALGHLRFLAREYGPKHIHQTRITGHEFSLIAISDGTDFRILPRTQVVKRRLADGRMSVPEGAFSPPADIPQELLDQARERIIKPTIAGMRALGTPYKGLLLIDMIVDDGQVRLLDYNSMIAYPETETLVARIHPESLVKALRATACGGLDTLGLQVYERAAVCIALMAKGYPGAAESGAIVTGMAQAREHGCDVYPIGVSECERPTILGNTSRAVLVVGHGDTVEKARVHACEGAEIIHFDGKWYNHDIGRDQT